jgi:hypothetical protein
MGKTWIRQDSQVQSTLETIIGFVDNTAPAATMESGAGHLADDLNSLRSIESLHLDVQAGNWYDDLNVPSALETGAKRGINNLNTGLHALEKKRVLRCTWRVVTGIQIAAAGNTFDILGTGEIPAQTLAAVGAVTSLGTVVADHNAAFGAHSLLEVAGLTTISPDNLVQIVAMPSRDPILDGADKIYGLLQSETAADGHTITDATTTRVQISFVKINGTGDDLIAITSGAMDGQDYDYCSVERVRLEDLNEGDFLGGANIDVPAGSTVTRQAGYTNQGATIVTTVANHTLDQGAGLTWEIGDLASAAMLQVIEGSGGGTSQLNIGAAVDEFDVDAAVNDFLAGITVRSGGTRPITVGVTDGLIETTAGDLEMKAAAELVLNDGNLVAEGTWAGPGVKLTEDAGEITAYEAAFGGEVSLFNAIVQASSAAGRVKVQSIVDGSNIAANGDVGGPAGTVANLTVDLPPYGNVTFVDDVDVFLNGELLRNGVDLNANEDVYPGTSALLSDLRFEDVLKGTGAAPDQLTMIVYGN